MNESVSVPLVLIEWDDSAQPVSAWRYLDDLPEARVIRCVSVGWLVHDGEQVKMLAPNMGDVTADGNTQASGIIRIPATAVTRMVPLSETGGRSGGFKRL